MIDGRPAFVTADNRPFAIEDETALIADVAALPADAPTQIRQVRSQSGGPLRYVAVQVRVAGQSEVGTLVAAVSLQPALDRLAASARLYAALSLAALVLVGAGRVGRRGPAAPPAAAAARGRRADLAHRSHLADPGDRCRRRHQLTRTVNAMLDRLENAFDTQQQFLDDAGHELRTPITIVRGHLEVLDAADPAEVTDTRALVMDELDRMARLVSDLIVLAQAGRPDFVRLEAVDLDRLLHDVLDKAEALAERALGARLDCARRGDGRRPSADPGAAAAHRQRGAPHPGGGHRSRSVGAICRRAGAPVGPRHRSRGVRPGRRADLRAVRPGRRAARGAGGLRAGPVHRKRDRRGSRRPGRAGPAAGGGARFTLGPAAAASRPGRRQPADALPVQRPPSPCRAGAVRTRGR